MATNRIQRPAQDADGWKTYRSDVYSIRYPGTWDLDHSGRMGLALQIFSPPASTVDSFRENVNLVVQDLSGQSVKTLDQYTQLSESQIKTMMTDSEILSSERKNRNGQDYQKVIFTAIQGKFKLKFEQYYLIEGKWAYVLTFAGEADNFIGYQEVGEKIMDSFRIPTE